MGSIFLVASLFVQSADSQAVAGLFDVLDADGDGRISSNEVSASQQPYFVRALRVSDRDEDGQLSRDELASAVANPQRVETSTGSRSGARMPTSFDPASLDKNKDGFVSKTEVPQSLQGRFKRMFDRAGSEQIAVEVLKRYLSYSQTPAVPQGKGSEKAKTERQTTNRTQEPAAEDSAGSVFDRLDRNSDGQLTGEEIPQRMRQSLRRIDRNGDRAISESEFAEVAKTLLRSGGNKK